MRDSDAAAHGPAVTRRHWLLGAGCGLPLVLAGIGLARPARAEETRNAVAVVSIANYRFDPPELRVRAGSTVRWNNEEKRVSHSILFAAGSELAGRESERLLPGDSWEQRFERPGRYPYTCGPHPEMRGLVVVE